MPARIQEERLEQITSIVSLRAVRRECERPLSYAALRRVKTFDVIVEVERLIA